MLVLADAGTDLFLIEVRGDKGNGKNIKDDKYGSDIVYRFFIT